MRRPRPRTVVAVVLALLVLVIAVAWLVPPLGTGNAGQASGPPGVDQGTDPDTGAAIITFVPAGSVAFGVEVVNTTFLPVTIDGLLDAGAEAFGLRDVRVVLGNDPTFIGLDDAHARPFETITLAPGATQLIGMVGRFPACANARPTWATGSEAGIRSLRLAVRVAGILPAQADVPLLIPVDLRGNADAACAQSWQPGDSRAPLIFSAVLLSRP